MVPAARLKFYRRVKRLTAVARGISPERLVRTVLYLWQQRSYEVLLPRTAPWGTAEYRKNAAVVGFADWLALQPFNEAAYWLAVAYAAWVGEETRTRQGLFFTPPALASRVITNLVSRGASLVHHHWHDPACGGAAFLVPIAQQMAAALAKTNKSARQQLECLERNLSGNDLDPGLLDLSRSFLEMALVHLIQRAGRRPAFTLLRGDGLTSSDVASIKPDVITCNPPYRRLKAEEVRQYQKLHQEVIEGQPNIYGLFIHRSLQLSRVGTLVGLLTPTSFLSGLSFAKLRTELLARADVLHLDMLSERTSMFIDVEQETAITLLRRRTPVLTRGATTDVSVLGPNGAFAHVGRYLLPNSGRPWPIPRAVADADLLRVAESNRFRLADYGYYARVGHLVAYRDQRRRFADAPHPKRGRTVLPLVWATDISPQGKFEHGRKTKLQRTGRFVEVEGISSSGVHTRPAVLVQRLTSSDQGSRVVAAAVPKEFVRKHGGFVCENHVIVLEPTAQAALDPVHMAALLNSTPVDRVFRSISGASNVAVFELNELLLPDPRSLARQCARHREMDAAVLAAYQEGARAAEKTSVRETALA